MKKLFFIILFSFLTSFIFSQEVVFKQVRDADSIKYLIENSKTGGAPVRLFLKNENDSAVFRLSSTGDFSINGDVELEGFMKMSGNLYVPDLIYGNNDSSAIQFIQVGDTSGIINLVPCTKAGFLENRLLIQGYEGLGSNDGGKFEVYTDGNIKMITYDSLLFEVTSPNGISRIISPITVIKGAVTISESGQVAAGSDTAVNAGTLFTYINSIVGGSVEAGTLDGQMLFWDTDTWKHSEISELFWDDVNKCLGVCSPYPGATLDVAGHIYQTQTGKSVFLGERAGRDDDLSENRNVYIGYETAKNATTGSNNVGVGYQSLFSVDGDYNVAVGFSVLPSVNGSYNTGVGATVLSQCISGSNNVAIGYNSSVSGQSYTDNVGVGSNSLKNLAIGNKNVALGSYAIYNSLIAHNNVAVGYQSLYSAVMDSNNTAIGYKAFRNTTGVINSTAIGFESEPTSSNQIMLGDNNVTEVKTPGIFNGTGLIISSSTAMTSVSTGSINNDKLPTKGYVDDNEQYITGGSYTNLTGILALTRRLSPDIAINLDIPRKVTVSLTSTQVNTLGTAINLIAAPGSGKYIRIINWDGKITVTTQLEVGIQDLYLEYTSGDRIGSIKNSCVETSSTKRFFGVIDNENIILSVNTGIDVVLSGPGNPTSGSVTMSFNITYEILTD